MNIKKLPHGHKAPESSDYIQIERLLSGLFEVSGVIIYDTSVAFGHQLYPTYGEAERAGLHWAAGHDAEHIFVVSLGA